MDVQLLSDLNGPGPKNHEDRIFSILFQEDELTWQTIIYDLVKTETMDPWDINISVIADRFISMLTKMKEMDFRVGGKMVLAAALLVKIKSDRLMKEDIVALDNLINSSEGPEDFLEELEEAAQERVRDKPSLVPRTPQPRQRKVSVYDLVEALEKALTTETKRSYRKPQEAVKVVVPKKGKDMSLLINEMYKRVRKGFSASRIITFDQLIPSSSKEDKVYTFIPLLHLDNQRKIDLLQKEHFGEIQVKVNKVALEE